jgi:gas vesicle protein
MADKKVIKSFMWGALTGAVTGAVTALLFAPKSGRELRQDLSETAQKVGEKTTDISRQAGAAVQTIARRTSEFASDAKQAAGRFVTDIRSRRSLEKAEAGEAEETGNSEEDDSELQ